MDSVDANVDFIGVREWKKLFRPIKNPLEDYSNGFHGCVLAANSEEHRTIAWKAYEKDPRTVWTWIELDGMSYLIAGWALMNRIGHIVCANPFKDEYSAPEVRMGYLSRWF